MKRFPDQRVAYLQGLISGLEEAKLGVNMWFPTSPSLGWIDEHYDSRISFFRREIVRQEKLLFEERQILNERAVETPYEPAEDSQG